MKRFFYILCAISLSSCGSDDSVPINDSQFSVEANGVLYDSFDEKDLVVYANSQSGIITVFERPKDGDSLRDFSPLDDLPYIMTDEFGTKYDVFGSSYSETVSDLQKVDGFFGFWFSFAAFYPFPSLIDDPAQLSTLQRETFTDWNVDPEFIIRGAPDGAIPAIDNPKFKIITDADRFLNGTLELANVFPADERIILFKQGNSYKAFPHAILNWHEIVFEDDYMVNYCPLTGTSFVVNNDGIDWNVSGLLYNNNLILADGTTNSKWSQIYLECVNGERRDETLERIESQEMTWEGLLEFAEKKQVAYLTTETGFARDYTFYPYGSYRENQGVFLFDNKYSDDRVPNKELVYGIISNGAARVYRFSDFQ
ncbi:DUF3179 domain-containing (seleno)protein [Ekhidna sp.]|uniref:DUF3179 domain-containing (seleno)protein n=1 Tax=Ekhidna sp. TaxID=2608089 RepID=UPI003B506429